MKTLQGAIGPDGPMHVDTLCRKVDRYYTKKIQIHGPTAMGVDWTCELTQKLRFVQLLKLCEFGSPFTLNDIGCGYGAMLGFLRERHGRRRFQYLGVDISAEMINVARSLWQAEARARFSVGRGSLGKCDYCVASGIFNVKLDVPEEVWTLFAQATIDRLFEDSSVGFAVNFLAPLPNEVQPKPELYRPSPKVWTDYCEKNFDADVEVISNYGMPEFTLLVRRARR